MMENLLLKNNTIPTPANYVQQGTGRPVILIHGLAASLHDWDDLIPELAASSHACYALDLLGHGDSPKPDTRLYQMDWVLEHFFQWVESLHLAEPPVLIGHSLGGRVALEYARRRSTGTRGLVLVNPFYSHSQLSPFLRKTYRYTSWSRLAAHPMPEKLIRLFVDFSSVATGRRSGAFHSLPERVRAQTALDYKRTAPGVYHIPKAISDMTQYLPEIDVSALVVWGDHDRTLSPSSFARVVEALPKARGEALPAGHVPHQSHPAAFNQIVMNFLKELP